MQDAARRFELMVGKAQHRALRWALTRGAGMRAAVATIGDLTIPYYDRGGTTTASTATLLVHGFGGDKETWLMMSMGLRRQRRLIIPDLPGHGAATPIAAARATARAQAEALCRLLDLLRIDRVDLVGNSMGAGIGMRLARDRPDRVRSLALIGSVGPEVEVKSEVAAALDRGENLLIPEHPDDADRFLALVAEKPPRVPRAIRRYVTAERIAARERLHEIFCGWRGCATAESIPLDLDRIDAPALVIHGERDRVIHPAVAEALAARLPRSRLLTMPGVGHLPQLEAPLQTARAVQRHIDRPHR
jgi:abhydrolase domain-containing protein 6